MLMKLIVINILLWAGMILGISFLESWAKFRAPSLTKPIGLDVGRTVFRFFHGAQCGLLLLLIFFSIIIKFELKQWLAIAILTSIMLLQLVWLFPKLSQRVNIVLAGKALPGSYVHTVYGILEVVKLLILIILSWTWMP